MKTRQVESRRLKKKGGSSSTKEPKLTATNTVFLDLRTTIEDCIAIIKAFNRLGYITYYDSKTKTLKTTAPEQCIKELSKLFNCIQSYSLIQKEAKQ